MLKKFGINEVREIGTLMSPITKLGKDEKGKDVNQKFYRGMIGLLLYLTTSKPDIMFSVCLCARFQAFPKESPLIALKRKISYWYSKLKLWHPKKSLLDLISFFELCW